MRFPKVLRHTANVINVFVVLFTFTTCGRGYDSFVYWLHCKLAEKFIHVFIVIWLAVVREKKRNSLLSNLCVTERERPTPFGFVCISFSCSLPAICQNVRRRTPSRVREAASLGHSKTSQLFKNFRIFIKFDCVFHFWPIYNIMLSS